jgi:pimeloyl-ACP methyl ester carboxylesterase
VSHILVADLRSHVDHVTNESYAMLTRAPEARHAVIFVHGFGGHPFKTWFRMQELLEADDRWKGTDAFFIGYKSTRDEIMLSARYLARIIRTLLPEPPLSMFRVYRSETTYQLRQDATVYGSADLVGHSLGGVVMRAAILELLRAGIDAAAGSHTPAQMPAACAFACSANLRLFAPAQGGARLAGLKGLARQTLALRGLVDLYGGRSPTFQELQPGSQLLQALREDTNYFADEFPSMSALRARIAWAHHDDVVTSLPFRHDASYTLVNSTHSTVCKPAPPRFIAPFEFVNGAVLDQEDGAL